MKKISGTMKFIIKEKKEYWQVKGPEPVIMLKRIIPSFDSPERGVVDIPNNLQNIEYLKWLMVLHPLEIQDLDKWKSVLQKFFKIEKQRESLSKIEYKEPSVNFNGKLMDYQKQCLSFIEKTGGCALVADEMGLGKTVMALAYMATQDDCFPALIVAPLVTLNHWVKESKQFLRIIKPESIVPDIPVEPSVEKIRSGKPGKLPKKDIYIINYDLLSRRIDDLLNLNLKSIVADEVHYLRKNDTSKYGAADQLLTSFSVQHRIGLSGTPIYNRGDEIFNIVNLLYPGLLGTFKEFFSRYCYSDFGKVGIGEESKAALHEKLTSTIMIRRKKEDVLKDLPPKTRITDVIAIDHDYYESEIQKMFKKLETEIQTINNQSMKKGKEFELSAAMERAFNTERITAGMSKAPYVAKYIDVLMQNEEKLVVFCHHILVHEYLTKALEKYNPCKIIGGQSDKQRQENIDEFQNNPERKIMIAGLRAGNVGISLTAAQYVLFAELDWSPSIHRQAEDRLHRINQKGSVTAHYLIGEETLDESIVNTLVDKSLTIDGIMGDKHEEENRLNSRQYLEELKMKVYKNIS